MRRKLVLIFTLMLVLGTLSACDTLKKSKTTPVLIENRHISMVTEPAVKMDIEEKFDVSGVIHSSKISRLSFSRTGYLTYYNAYMGQEVKKGDLLAAIDVSDIEHNMKISKLKLEQKSIDLSLAQRTGDLYKIKEAEIAYEMQKMEVDKFDTLYANSTLLAPFDGVVSTLTNREIGTRVNQGYTLINIMDVNEIGIKFLPGQKMVSKLSEGDSLELTVNGVPYESEVMLINNNQVYAEVPQEIASQVDMDYEIQVKKILKTYKDAMMVPSKAVYKEGDNTYRVRVLVGEEVRVIPVEVGIKVDELIQVIGDVHEGDLIIIK